jgi:hypothetical protein
MKDIVFEYIIINYNKYNMKYTNKININSKPHSYTIYYTKIDENIYIKLLNFEFTISQNISENMTEFLKEKKWTDANIETLRAKFFDNNRVTTIFIS